MTEDEFFRCVLDMAEAARHEDSSAWMQARCRTRSADDSAYLSSMLLGLLVENEAVRRGEHPADAWHRLRTEGIDSFG
ncbi:hypothetical protein [Rhodococcus sp. HNM0569]|uniref:hypothetical protein n=1 Tax=Rhodococcus sp. HNM0569 TaxID=2716340 RepID=UPI00146DA752|nr:hypothetical protein [Rhodococcus sp. HNM0569]NLU82530.1 hypothetical protein [Rhodococcus sp. HNM0569]